MELAFVRTLKKLSAANKELTAARNAMNASSNELTSAVSIFSQLFEPSGNPRSVPAIIGNAAASAPQVLVEIGTHVDRSDGQTKRYLAALQKTRGLTNNLKVQYQTLVLLSRREDIACAGGGHTSGRSARNGGTRAPVAAANSPRSAPSSAKGNAGVSCREAVWYLRNQAIKVSGVNDFAFRTRNCNVNKPEGAPEIYAVCSCMGQKCPESGIKNCITGNRPEYAQKNAKKMLADAALWCKQRGVRSCTGVVMIIGPSSGGRWPKNPYFAP
ncbi:MAG: hypothetical protein R3E48_13405 [Burkholderiaceae bacterium]